MAKKTSPLILTSEEKAAKANLIHLRNYLRHESNRTDGRVTRHFERHTHTMHIEVSKRGWVRVCISTNGFYETDKYILDVRLRGEKVTIEGIRIEKGLGIHRDLPMTQAAVLKQLRQKLKHNFPGYTKPREEWKPPVKEA